MSVVSHETHEGSFFQGIGAKFEAVITWFERNSRRGRAARHASYLLQKSDEELAELGLTRNGIILQAFGPYLA